jgi:hypothetical protein
VFLFAPVPSFAQSAGDVSSIESVNLGDIANDSIVVLSKNEMGVPGYVHVKYAFVHLDCPGGVQLVDYYGSAFDPNDPIVRSAERRQCSQSGEDKDGE